MGKALFRKMTIGSLVIALFATLSAAAQADGPRLKFKGKGPVCMCSGDGLSEADIRRAEEARNRSRSNRIQQPDREKRKEANNRDEADNQE